VRISIFVKKNSIQFPWARAGPLTTSARPFYFPRVIWGWSIVPAESVITRRWTAVPERSQSSTDSWQVEVATKDFCLSRSGLSDNYLRGFWLPTWRPEARRRRGRLWCVVCVLKWSAARVMDVTTRLCSGLVAEANCVRSSGRSGGIGINLLARAAAKF